MNPESQRVLELLSQGKITVAEAEQLLKAVSNEATGDSTPNASPNPSPSGDKPKPKYLCVNIEPLPGAGSRHKGPVNIRLPLDVLRSGIKLAGIMPGIMQGRLAERLHEKGIDFTGMKPDQFEAVVATLSDLHLDVDSDRSRVRIYCE
jgi:hypothetical protein